MEGTEDRGQPVFLCSSEGRAVPMEKVFASSDSADMAKACLVESQVAKEINFIAAAVSASVMSAVLSETCGKFIARHSGRS